VQTAIAYLRGGIKGIAHIMPKEDRKKLLRQNHEARILLDMLKQIRSQLPPDPRKTLQTRLKDAIAASVKAHSAPSKKPMLAEPGHNKNEGLWNKKFVVYGALDGVLTSTVLLAALTSCDVAPYNVLAIASGVIIALAVAFGLRDFMRHWSDQRHYEREKDREKWELENFPAGEQGEMVELYTSRGLSKEDAVAVISKLAEYKEFFVDLMMSQELHMQAPEGSPVTNGLCTLGGFLVSGGIPLFCYFLAQYFAPWRSNNVPLDWSAMLLHPVTVSAVVAIVTTGAIAFLNLKLLPERNRISIYVCAFLACCVVAGIAFACTFGITAFIRVLLPPDLKMLTPDLTPQKNSTMLQ